MFCVETSKNCQENLIPVHDEMDYENIIRFTACDDNHKWCLQDNTWFCVAYQVPLN